MEKKTVSKRTYALMVAFVVLLMAVMATTMVIAQGPPGGNGTGPIGNVDVDEVREDVIRSLLEENGEVVNPDQQIARVAIEQPGGFGGFYFDESDESIAYIYMKDTSQVESAEAVFRAAYHGDRPVTQIIPVQGDYSFDDLVRWYHALDKALVNNEIHPSEGSVSELENRIVIGLPDASQFEDARRVMRELGIPEGAVNLIEEDYAQLLGGKDDVDSKWRPLVGGIRHQQVAYGVDCTIGFVTERHGVEGLVLASHCTNEVGRRPC